LITENATARNRNKLSTTATAQPDSALNPQRATRNDDQRQRYKLRACICIYEAIMIILQATRVVGNYRDIIVHVKMAGHPHICEIQLHLQLMESLKNQLGPEGHARYLRFRDTKFDGL
jgi:hypothetical protein